MRSCASNICKTQPIKMAFLKDAFVPFNTTCAMNLFTCLEPKRKYQLTSLGGTQVNGSSNFGSVFSQNTTGGTLTNGSAIDSEIEPSFLLLDNFNGAAGLVTATTADSGQTRIQTTGDIALSGDGYAYHDGNSPDDAYLSYSPEVSVTNGVYNITLASEFGDSPYFIFNVNPAGSGTGWVVYSNDDNDQVYVVRYDSLNPPNSTGDSGTLNVIAGIADGEIVDVTITVNGDDITLTCKGSSQTFNFPSRQYKTDDKIRAYFFTYDQNDRLYKIEIPE